MARTKEQLIDILATHKQKELFETSLWSDLAGSVGGLDSIQRDALLTAVITKDNAQAGYFIVQALQNDAKARATVAAEAILADDSISLVELDDLL